jgi:hypothetical protein
VLEPGSDAAALVDAGELVESSSAEARAADDAPNAVPTDPDAGAGAHDAGTSPPPPPVDAGGPPKLCCATPCSGSQVANITCGDWTCAAGSCGAGACGVGALCSWMQGSCVGHVVTCP